MSNLNFDVLYDCGEAQTPGIEIEAYVACSCDVEDPFPGVVGSIAQGDSIRIEDDITLVAGAKFVKIKMITDKGEVKNTQKAEAPSSLFEQSLMFETVRGEDYAEFFNNNRNGCFIVIAIEKTGKQRVIGHPKKGPARLRGIEETTGMGETPGTWKAEFFASPGDVAPYYEGAIDLTA